ncbi:MAG: hypothetical protein ORN54_03020 [Cyclobacteriaceae bacterium]|nr:hypothetical protein [Cyclobacteriaceae bacterium]
MSTKPSVQSFFTVALAAWLLTFTIVSVGFYKDETASENASIVTKLHPTNLGYLPSEPCEEREIRDTSNEYQAVLISACLHGNLGTVNTSLNRFWRLYSVSCFGNTTNLPLYLAKKSFLI